MKVVKTGQKQFYDDIITDDEYRLLKAALYQERDRRDYFLVRILTSTGMRVSELLTIEADDIRCGYKDVVSKGNKMRRVYFPKRMRREAEEWLRWSRIVHGKIFRNRKGLPLTQSGIRFILRQCAERYGIPPGHVHPHAFRHRYALNFLQQNSDITLLADLLGHENIETTRLYLKRTQEEQRRIVDEIVNW